MQPLPRASSRCSPVRSASRSRAHRARVTAPWSRERSAGPWADYTDSGAKPMTGQESLDLHAAKRALAEGARALGFSELGVADVTIPEDERHLLRWLDAGFEGEMAYMRRHGTLRSRPQELAPGSVRVVSVRMNYWPAESADAQATLGDPSLGYVSRYALGRDYHKLMRRALARLAEQLQQRIGRFGYRVCVDSAP